MYQMAKLSAGQDSLFLRTHVLSRSSPRLGGDRRQTGSIRTKSELETGSLIYADGRFYCLTAQGMMTLQKPTADGFQTVGSFRIGEGRDIWAHPVICNGRLYLRVHETLFCYDIGS